MVAQAICAIDFHSRLIPCQCRLTLYDDRDGDGDPNSAHAEAVELQEDRRYWYELSTDADGVVASMVADGRVVRQRPNHQSQGVIDTRSQAGLLAIKVRLSRGPLEDVMERSIEVLPVKFDLATFRSMIDDICRSILGLALRLNASARIPLRVGDRLDASGAQQRFFFLKHLFGDEQFRLALEQITKSPHSRVDREPSRKSLLATRRLGRDANRVVASGANRSPLPSGHPLVRLGSIPRTAVVLHPSQTVDTPENQFIKFALEEFIGQLRTIQSACEMSPIAPTRRIAEEAAFLQSELQRPLEHSLFREVGPTSILPLGSPVLQRRPGYREVLEAWFKYHVAASLQWEGGEDVFGAGKKDTDKLYEYWLFFELLKILSIDLGISMPAADTFLAESEDGLSFRLKAGKNFTHQATIATEGQALTVRFSYNRTFSGCGDVGSDGSWSLAMRPDFTVSFWPAHIDERSADWLNLTVHLHFDSKYRLRGTRTLFEGDEDLDRVRDEEKKGTYKRGDILIAHAYRDAIRRSGGAYIIYPGSDANPELRQEYHEVLPGLGAFPVRPTTHGGASGIEKIGELFKQVVKHLSRLGSARERVSHAVWEAYGSPWSSSAMFRKNGPVPQAVGDVLLALPESCFPLEWVLANSIYPLRLSNDCGEAIPSSKALNAAVAVILPAIDCDCLRLVAIDREKIRYTVGADIESEHGPVPSGAYAMLPLDLESAMALVPREPDSLERLRHLSTEFVEGIASLRTILQYVGFEVGA